MARFQLTTVNTKQQELVEVTVVNLPYRMMTINSFVAAMDQANEGDSYNASDIIIHDDMRGTVVDGDEMCIIQII